MRRLVFDQSSPVQPVSESRGGTLSVTFERTEGRTKEILVSNLGLTSVSHVTYLVLPTFLAMLVKTEFMLKPLEDRNAVDCTNIPETDTTTDIVT